MLALLCGSRNREYIQFSTTRIKNILEFLNGSQTLDRSHSRRLRRTPSFNRYSCYRATWKILPLRPPHARRWLMFPRLTTSRVFKLSKSLPWRFSVDSRRLTSQIATLGVVNGFYRKRFRSSLRSPKSCRGDFSIDSRADRIRTCSRTLTRLVAASAQISGAVGFRLATGVFEGSSVPRR